MLIGLILSRGGKALYWYVNRYLNIVTAFVSLYCDGKCYLYCWDRQIDSSQAMMAFRYKVNYCSHRVADNQSGG